jgi:type IV secretory pathway VirB2 component (pilin)
MTFLHEIKLQRVVLAIVLVFIVADTSPHPSLSPGLIEHTLNKLQSVFEAPTATLGLTVGNRQM